MSAPLDVPALLLAETLRANREHAQAFAEARDAVIELKEALRQSNEAMAMARARWPGCPSPSQTPAAEAIAAATARNNAAITAAGGLA